MVIDISKYRPDPHVVIQCYKAVHVVPVSVFDDIAGGSLDVEDLDDWKDIMKIIIKEWVMEMKRNDETTSA